jgi:zinc protease
MRVAPSAARENLNTGVRDARGATRAPLIAMLAITAIAAPAKAQFPTTPPPAMPLKAATFPPFREATLPNGMKLVLVESHEQPLISATLAFPAGSAYDPAGKEGTASFVATLLTKGAGARSAEEFSEAIESVGGSINAGNSKDFLTISASALTPNAGLAFEMLADAVMRPTFPATELELVRTQTLSALQLQLSSPSALASRFFEQSVYGKHPYGRQQTVAATKAITRDDLVAFQKARLRPGAALMVIAGDMNLATARTLIDKSFAGWTGAAPATVAFAPPPPRTSSEILLVNRPGSVQSTILVGNTTWTANDPQFYAALMGNRILGSGASSRLFNIIREQKSYTYSVGSGLSRPKGVGLFQASTDVRTEVTDSALVVLLEQLRLLGAQPVTSAELDMAKSAMVGSFPLTIETASQVAGAVANAKLLGLPADYLQTYRTRLAAVTPAQIQAAARRTIRPGAALIVVVGDGPKIYDKLKAIGPVRIVDVQGNPVAPGDLVAKAGALDVDASKLVARTDSFTVMVQGNPLGWRKTVLERAGSGFRFAQEMQISTAIQQSLVLLFNDKLQMESVKQMGKVQGMDVNVDVAYANGRAKGSSTTPTATGPKTIAIDTMLPAGAIDDNLLQAVMPALRWTPTSKWTVQAFSSATGAVQQLTLAVAGKESVTVPAGTFDAYRVDLSGGERGTTFYVSVAEPHRVLKISPVGAPIEFVLAK